MDTEILLRQVDPARGAEIPKPESAEAARIRQVAISRPCADQPVHGTTVRRSVGISIGAVVAVAAAVILLVVLLPASGGPFSSKASAALTRLAAQAATAPPSSLGAGQYAYTEVERPVMTSVGSEQPGGPSITEYFTGTVQTWVAADGSGRQVTTTDPTPDFYTAADRAAWVAEGSPPGVILPSQLITVQVFGPNTASEVNGPIPLYNVTGLPTEPTTLSQLLDNENPGAQSLGTLPAGIKSLDFASSCDTAACTLFERAAALLQGPDIGATPALRQALFQVLATVPGVELLGTTADPTGQSGIRLALVEHRPAGTTVIECRASDQASPGSPGGILYGANTNSTTITSSTTEHYPATSTTFSIVVDPQTTTLLASEESYSPFNRTMPASPPCGPASQGLQKTETTEMGPDWLDVVSSGVASSDTSLPSGGSQ
jgi:hypothetical protein